ncbi:MAG TPA: hypothetical protein VIL48_10520 [Acidimicrobiales bacterium]
MSETCGTTYDETDDTTSRPASRAAADPTADASWMAWTAGGLGAVWVAVALTSALAPDMVTGSEQQHMPVAAFGTWLWGLAATAVFLWSMGRLRGSAERRPVWTGTAAATAAVWLAATVVSVATPVVETGSDPTRLPVGAMVAPVAALVLTFLVGTVAAVFARGPQGPGQ